MSVYVFSRASAAVRWRGNVIRLNVNDIWPADDPFVKDHPALFTPDPPNVHRTTAAPVEQASAVPGEKRSTRRA